MQKNKKQTKKKKKPGRGKKPFHGTVYIYIYILFVCLLKMMAQNLQHFIVMLNSYIYMFLKNPFN